MIQSRAINLPVVLKIQQFCFQCKVKHAAHNMILLLLLGIVSQGPAISEQSSVNYLCEKLFQPEHRKKCKPLLLSIPNYIYI